MKRIRQILAAMAALTLLLPAALAAQANQDWEASRLHASREQLQALLAAYEQGSSETGYSDAVRRIARGEAELIEQRLTEGDFQIGDQIDLAVTGITSLTGTFTVSEGRVLQLPEIGAVPLAGLLRSELQEGLEEYLSKYIREPEIFARSKIRISVWGAVGSPGYHVVPSDMLLTDVLAAAGQPSSGAEQDEIKIKRGDEVIWEGDALAEAIVQGRTIDQMNLRAGDQINVPGSTQAGGGRGGLLGLFRNFYYIIPLGLAISRLF
ncbi:MAG: polysaccharide biosynthesis/export family protein [Longimicrobiales bacterium]